MEQTNDVAYYRRREARARQMADATSDHAIKRIHLDLADRYAEKVRELTPKPRLIMI